MLLNEKSEYSDKEIIEIGSRVLIKELGYSGFVRYIRQIENIAGDDYLRVQNDIFKDMSIDEIHDEAKKYHEG